LNSVNGKAPKLDPREEHFAIPGPHELALFVRYLRSEQNQQAARRAVVYVHGATFPSALSIAHRFGGSSWRDALCSAGFDVWGFDFAGFGHSDRYPQMSEPANAHAPLCTAADAARQLETVVESVLEHQALDSVSLISHSWGAMPAGRFAAAHPSKVDRWVLFAPICRRAPRRYEKPPVMPAWRLISIEDQWARFTEDVPAHESPVLSRREFEEWAQRYLDSDPDSRTRHPPAVQTPLGPFSEIIAAWHGELGFEPRAVAAPIAIIRGAWDGLVPDEDARWLFEAFERSPLKRDIKISHATHLMHLEKMRGALWRESIAFLQGDEVAQLPRE
jgi:pimeloyl-ACP methyl ester carboxylesterase